MKDPDVCDPIRYLREREIIHFQRFGEALRHVQDHLDSRNFYAFNPAFDTPAGQPESPTPSVPSEGTPLPASAARQETTPAQTSFSSVGESNIPNPHLQNPALPGSAFRNVSSAAAREAGQNSTCPYRNGL